MRGKAYVLFGSLSAALGVWLLVLCLINRSVSPLGTGIAFVACGILLLFFPKIERGLRYEKRFCISFRHEYYSGGFNVFEGAETVKTAPVRKYKNQLNGKLAAETYRVLYHKASNLKFTVYELKDDFQLIVVREKNVEKSRVSAGDFLSDRKKNVDLFVGALGIAAFPDGNFTAVYPSEDKRTVVAVKPEGGKYATAKYEYTIGCSFHIRQAFSRALPHWEEDIDFASAVFDRPEEAENAALAEINAIDGESCAAR